MKVRDAETGHEMVIDTSSAKFRHAHTRFFMDCQEKLRQIFAKSSVDWMSVGTDEDYVKALMLLFKRRG